MVDTNYEPLFFPFKAKDRLGFFFFVFPFELYLVTASTGTFHDRALRTQPIPQFNFRLTHKQNNNNNKKGRAKDRKEESINKNDNKAQAHLQAD